MKRRYYIVLVYLVIILLVIVLNREKISSLISDISYRKKLNKTYVSREFNIDIEDRSVNRKNHLFWGKDRETHKEKYIIFVYKKGNYVVYADEGMSREEAFEIAEDKGISQYMSFYINPSFSKNNDIKKYLYWLFTNDDEAEIYIKFDSGEIIYNTPD